MLPKLHMFIFNSFHRVQLKCFLAEMQNDGTLGCRNYFNHDPMVEIFFPAMNICYLHLRLHTRDSQMSIYSSLENFISNHI